jgi:hypothetical protein
VRGWPRTAASAPAPFVLARTDDPGDNWVMKKRIPLLMLALGLLACFGVVALVAAPRRQPPQPRVNPENFRRLSLGMSAQQVEAVLGRPPDPDYAPSHHRVWRGERCRVLILFDETWAVEELWPEEDTGTEQPPFWDQLRHLLPW